MCSASDVLQCDVHCDGDAEECREQEEDEREDKKVKGGGEGGVIHLL